MDVSACRAVAGPAALAASRTREGWLCEVWGRLENFSSSFLVLLAPFGWLDFAEKKSCVRGSQRQDHLVPSLPPHLYNLLIVNNNLLLYFCYRSGG